MVDWVTLTFAFGLGVGSFFSPCSVALIPAYVSYFVGASAEPGTERSRLQAFLGGLRFGAVSALGVFGVFAGAGALIYGLRTSTDITSPQLTLALALVAIVVALGVVALGILFIIGKGPTFAVPVHAPRQRTIRGMVLFGSAYALASLGCTGALFLAAIAQVLTQGPVGGLFVTVAYAIGLGGTLLIAAVVLTLAEDAGRRMIRTAMPYVRPVAGTVMVLSGLYVIFYYAFVAPPF